MSRQIKNPNEASRVKRDEERLDKEALGGNEETHRGLNEDVAPGCVDIDGTFLVRWFAFYRTMPTIVRPP